MICQDPHCEEHYGCRLRKKGLQVSPRVGEARTRNWKPTPDTPPSHYANILYDKRPDGSMMPVMKPDGSLIRHREYQRDKVKIDAVLKNHHNGTA